MSISPSLLLVLVVGACACAEPVNRFVKVDDSPSGGRSSAMFFYEPTLKRFVLVGGVAGGNYHSAKRHFEVEQFDPATHRWTNAYPDGAPYQAASGITDAPATEEG